MAIRAFEKAFRPWSYRSHPAFHLLDLTSVPKFVVKVNSVLQLPNRINQMPGSAGSPVQKNGDVENGMKCSKWNKYVLSKEIAPNVFLAYDEFSQKVVIKKLPNKAGCSSLPKEALAGMILRHEN